MKIAFGEHPTLRVIRQECHKCGKESLTIWAICDECYYKDCDSDKKWYKDLTKTGQ